MVDDSLNKYNELKKKYEELQESYKVLQELCVYLCIDNAIRAPINPINCGTDGHYDVCRCASDLSYTHQEYGLEKLRELQKVNMDGPKQAPCPICSHENPSL